MVLSHTYFLNQLAINLLRLLVQNEPPQKNVIFSPHSLYTCLGTLQLAADGVTREEFVNVLGQNFVEPQYQTILSDVLQFHANVAVNYNCYMFIYNSLNETFQNIVNANLNAHLHPLNMLNKPGAAAAINQCVNRTTLGVVPCVVSPQQISSNDRLILVNAVFFRETWKIPFASVGILPFQTRAGPIIPVQMMQMTNTMKYLRDDPNGLTIFNLEYSNMRFFAMVILPDDPIMFMNFINSFTADQYYSILSTWVDSPVSLTFPRFDISSKSNLEEYMKKLGLVKVFDPIDAELPLLSVHHTHLSKLTQTGRLIVNQNSTTATNYDIGVFSSALATPPIEVVVNKPFMFVIYDSISQAMIMTSLVGDPNGSGDPDPMEDCKTTESEE
uniref:Serpin 1 n=1 Tax=Sphaerospora molnari TaxID=182359 RepID=A0A7M3V7C0_9CNID|nr:serpin 1 [Sphaerospora molnari]